MRALPLSSAKCMWHWHFACPASPAQLQLLPMAQQKALRMARPPPCMGTAEQPCKLEQPLGPQQWLSNLASFAADVRFAALLHACLGCAWCMQGSSKDRWCQHLKAMEGSLGNAMPQGMIQRTKENSGNNYSSVILSTHQCRLS